MRVERSKPRKRNFTPTLLCEGVSTNLIFRSLRIIKDDHFEIVHTPTQVTFLAPARPMSDLIEESGLGDRIDFLSLDVEGAELSVLGELILRDTAFPTSESLVRWSRHRLLLGLNKAQGCFLILVKNTKK